LVLGELVQVQSAVQALQERIVYLVLLHLLAVAVVVRIQVTQERLEVAVEAVLFLRLAVRHHLRHKELLVVLAHLIKVAVEVVRLERE
jgi:TRAP-type C4-dicarboxylate transport system permease large subunit